MLPPTNNVSDPAAEITKIVDEHFKGRSKPSPYDEADKLRERAATFKDVAAKYQALADYYIQEADDLDDQAFDLVDNHFKAQVKQ